GERSARGWNCGRGRERYWRGAAAENGEGRGFRYLKHESSGRVASARAGYEPFVFPGARRASNRHYRRERATARYLSAVHWRAALGRYLFPIGRHGQPRVRLRRASHHTQSRRDIGIEDIHYRL